MGIGRLGQNFNLGLFSSAAGVNKNANVNPFYQNTLTKDTFTHSNNTSNPIGNEKLSFNIQGLFPAKQLLNAYTDANFVENLMDENPSIIKMLNDKGVDAQVYPENISETTKAHLEETTAYALDIANEMGLSKADKQTLEQASMLHDFGKILIPTEILNKPDVLNKNEKEIMDLHSELGYELLKTTGMNSRVLNLVKNHHSPAAETDTLGQILSVADIYSALRENRSYKSSMSEADAFSILDQKAKNGEVSAEVVEALKNSVMAKAA